jgi:hypothetical protein
VTLPSLPKVAVRVPCPLPHIPRVADHASPGVAPGDGGDSLTVDAQLALAVGVEGVHRCRRRLVEVQAEADLHALTGPGANAPRCC